MNRIIAIGIAAAAVMLGLSPAAWGITGARPAITSAAPAAAGVAPAGVGDYSYIELRESDMGSSDYFGDSASGAGAKFSFQFGRNAYVWGSYDRLDFDRLPGRLYRSGVGIGYAETEGRVSAYVQIAWFREMLSAALGGARSYYFEPAYGMRAAITDWFLLTGEIYGDLKPDFGSRPWGVKLGAAFAFGPVSLRLLADHNRDVNTFGGALRFAF